MRELNGIFVQAWYPEEPEALENAEGNEDEEDGLFFGLLFDIETLRLNVRVGCQRSWKSMQKTMKQMVMSCLWRTPCPCERNVNCPVRTSDTSLVTRTWMLRLSRSGCPP